jgi:Fe-S cluster assembly ATPase SufC
MGYTRKSLIARFASFQTRTLLAGVDGGPEAKKKKKKKKSALLGGNLRIVDQTVSGFEVAGKQQSSRLLQKIEDDEDDEGIVVSQLC